MKSKFILLWAGIVVGLALMVGGWKLWDSSYQPHGAQIDPPAPAAEIQLQDQNGQTFRLSAQRGKVVLLFFGYTHCPDVCPVTLSTMKQVKQRLGSLAGQVAFVFVTVDPQRDTPAVMKPYLASFDPAFTGLSGDEAQLAAVWRDYGVYRQKVDGPTPQTYSMDHSARIYVIDPQGNWIMNYPFGTEAAAIVQDLDHLLRSR